MTQPRSLNSVKVVERVGCLAGSVCAHLLCDQGADLCRVFVEGDPLPGEAAAWQAHPIISAGETRVDLDRGSSGFQEKWKELVAQADVVIVTPPIEDGKIPDLEHVMRGLDTNRQVVCALSPFGLDADDVPLSNPDEIEMQALSGLLATTGDTNEKPAVVDLPVLETFTGFNATTAIVAALRAKEMAKGGQLLDMAVFDSSFALTGVFLGKILEGQSRGFRCGCRHPLVAPWNAYQTSDGWVIICTTNDQQWLDMLDVMGEQALSEDPRFATSGSRIANVQEVDDLVSKWTRTKTTQETLASLQERGISIGSVTGSGSVKQTDMPQPCRRSEALTSAAVIPASVTHDKLADPPCKGVRVLEVGPYTAGPLAGRILANLGAQVIKVEAPGGENSRAWLPQAHGVSRYFANYNAGKQSVVLDLRSRQGKDAFLELVKSSDVLLHNLRAGAMERLGLGASDIFTVNPRIIYCGISGYGHSGAKRPSLDTVIQAEAGLLSLIASDNGPTKAGFSVADLAAAHLAPAEILAALRHADRTGHGQCLDISMLETVAWMIAFGRPEGRGILPPSTMLQTKDGWIVALCDSRDLESHVTRTQAAIISSGKLVERLTAAGVRATKMYELDEVFNLPIIKQRNLLRYEHNDESGTCIIAAPFLLTGTPATNDCTVAAAGRDNMALLGSPQA